MSIVTEIINSHGLSALAATLKVSYQAIRKWEKLGVPADRVLSLSEISNWTKTPHMIRPDIYPDPDDGLPAELRLRKAA